jgi:hypothetical protein
MIAHLSETASDRKLRLFAVACCREIEPFFKIPGKRKSDEVAVSVAAVLEVAERFADGVATEEERKSACLIAQLAELRVCTEWMVHVVNAAAWAIQKGKRRTDSWPHPIGRSTRDSWVSQAALSTACAAKGQRRIQCELLHDIFGNPFRPITINPAWQTSNVVSLAQAIYDHCAFDRMPSLADAHEDAGCTNSDILNPCRQPSEHVRGCWVVDLNLGKK